MSIKFEKRFDKQTDMVEFYLSAINSDKRGRASATILIKSKIR